MYQALYRKWRSQTFDDVVGQEHVSETLRRQVQSGRLSHAYLFVGTRGTGKTSCARILAKAINCKQPVGGNPCNKCASCVGIDNGSILDITEMDAASNNGVEYVRTLRDEAVFTPVDVKKRVYIIDEVHMLSTAAFNALLKILEEPPEHLVFILATTEIHKVPATILSRCQRYSFKRILPERIAQRLLYVSEKEGISLTQDAAALLARLADGSLRDALSLLDQCSTGETVDYERVVSAVGLSGSDETAALLSAVADGNVPDALTILDRLYTNGKVMSTVLDELQSLIRDVLLLSLMPKGSSGLLSGGFDTDNLKAFAAKLPSARLLLMSDIIRTALFEISKGTGARMVTELCIMRLSDLRQDSSTSALALRVTELENKLENGIPAAPRTAFADAATPASSQSPKASPQAIIKTPVPDTTSVAVSKPEEPDEQHQTAAAEPSSPPTSTASAKPQLQSATDGKLWPDIMAAIRPILDIPYYPVLLNQVIATVEGTTLSLGARTPFALDLLNKTNISDAIREAVPRVSGRNMAIRVALDTGAVGGATDKLDALKKFGNITFE